MNTFGVGFPMGEHESEAEGASEYLSSSAITSRSSLAALRNVRECTRISADDLRIGDTRIQPSGL